MIYPIQAFSSQLFSVKEDFGGRKTPMKVFSKKGTFQLVLSLVALSMLLAACGNSGTTPGGTTTTAPVNGKGCTKVGVLLPETASSARWDSKDKPLLTSKIE